MLVIVHGYSERLSNLHCEFLLQTDSLVNSVGSDLNLSSGMASNVILQKAGPRLQTACNALKSLNMGEVKQTKGFNLPCKSILHCVCPQWRGPGTVQVRAAEANHFVFKSQSNLRRFMTSMSCDGSTFDKIFRLCFLNTIAALTWKF